MSVVSFEEYTPPARYDAAALRPWTQIRIEEAANLATGAPAAVWTAIETVAIAGLPGGVDADPSQPQPRSFTTELATQAQGWYRVVFIDATGDLSPATIPVQNTDPGGVAWAPSVRDVAHLMFERVQGEFAVQTTFSNSTRPTSGQVMRAIRQAVSIVAPRLGFTVDAMFHDSARTFTTLMVASLLEPSFWASEARPDKSAWEQWQQLYKDGMPGLIEAIREKGAGDDPGPKDDALKPVYSFPAAPAAAPTRQDYIDRWLAGGGW